MRIYLSLIILICQYERLFISEFMTSALGQYLFYKPATFKTRMIHITTKYRPIYKRFGIVLSVS